LCAGGIKRGGEARASGANDDDLFSFLWHRA
jgi:hypothetical protein